MAEPSFMSMPREIIPGAFYLLTRRCAQRMFLLRPDETTNEIFEYCLAVAAKRCEVGIVAWCAMSNHYHAVVHDPEGRLPEFIAYFHRLVAACLNERWERWENLWSSEETCVTRLVKMQDVVDKVVYTLVNPLAAHVADRLIDWPGSSSLDFLDGETRTINRPKFFFSDTGVMDETVKLRTIKPPGLSSTWAAWAAEVRSAVNEVQITVRAERRRKGIIPMKKEDVLRARPTSKPAKDKIRRKLRPHLACKDEERREIEIGNLQAFRIAHRLARKAFCEGKRDVKFPAGTYRFRELGVRCLRHPPLYM